jgi:F0F1-type ATP synthase assembly protein I
LSTPSPDTAPKLRSRPDWREMRRRTDAMSLGVEMVMAVALGAYLGHLWDGHFGHGPWGMVFFVVAGIGAAAKAVLRTWRQTRDHLARSGASTPSIQLADRPAHVSRFTAAARPTSGAEASR